MKLAKLSLILFVIISLFSCGGNNKARLDKNDIVNNDKLIENRSETQEKELQAFKYRNKLGNDCYIIIDEENEQLMLFGSEDGLINYEHFTGNLTGTITANRKYYLSGENTLVSKSIGHARGNSEVRYSRVGIEEALRVKNKVENWTQRYSERFSGKLVYFGNIEQDNDIEDGSEVIEWVILKQEGSKALLISNYILAVDYYNTSDGYVGCSWKDSRIRDWLNNDFFNEVFSPEEQKKILKTTIAEDGMTSYDYVFLPSANEIELISGTKNKRASGTTYVNNHVKGYSTKEHEMIDYWLRDTNEKEVYKLYIDDEGQLKNTHKMVCDLNGIRPAIWVDLAKIN